MAYSRSSWNSKPSYRRSGRPQYSDARHESRGVLPFFLVEDRWHLCLQSSISYDKGTLKLDPLRGKPKPFDLGDETKTACRKFFDESFRLFDLEPEALRDATIIQGVYLIQIQDPIDLDELREGAKNNMDAINQEIKQDPNQRSPPLGLEFPAIEELQGEDTLVWIPDASSVGSQSKPLRVGAQVSSIISTMKSRGLLDGDELRTIPRYPIPRVYMAPVDEVATKTRAIPEMKEATAVAGITQYILTLDKPETEAKPKAEPRDAAPKDEEEEDETGLTDALRDLAVTLPKS